MKSISSVVSQDLDTIIRSLGQSVQALQGKTLLISGSSGFLGSYLMAVLQRLNHKVLKKPCKVIALDNQVTGISAHISEAPSATNFTLKKADICTPLSVRGPVDYIIHMAGIASPVYYMKYPLETIRTATTGTQNLLELAKQKKSGKFLFFSSSEIYGDPPPDAVPTKESYKGNVSSIGPRACYDESKRLGETFCTVYHKLYAIPVQIVRPFNVYGPGMNADDRRVIPQFLSYAEAGKPIPIHGNGLQTRSYCYITDAITGFLKTLFSRRSGEVYNIGNQQTEINLVDLARMILKVTKKQGEVAHIPYPEEYPSDEPSRRCPDVSKAAKEFGFTPKVDLATGLKRMAVWYKERYAD